MKTFKTYISEHSGDQQQDQDVALTSEVAIETLDSKVDDAKIQEKISKFGVEVVRNMG